MEEAPLAKRPLLLNMDETSVQREMQPLKGTVSWRKRRRGPLRPTMRIRKSDMRQCATWAAVLCDDTAIQPMLPQWILTNWSTVAASKREEYQGALPANWTIRRQKSAWMNQDTMVAWLERLHETLKGFPERQPILLVDTHRSHLQEKVWTRARELGIWMSVVPPNLTPYIQVADTHLFCRYKRDLRRRLHREKVHAADGTVSTKTWLVAVSEVGKRLLTSTTWEKAFLENGWGKQQQDLGSWALKSLGFAAPPLCEDTCPPLATLNKLVPRGLKECPLHLIQEAPLPALPPPAPPPPLEDLGSGLEPRVVPRFRLAVRTANAEVEPR